MTKRKKARKYSSTLHFSQLSIFTGHNFLISVYQGDFQTLDDFLEQCKMSWVSKRDEVMGKSSGYLLHTIIDVLINNLFHILLKIEGNLDNIEDVVFDDRLGISRKFPISEGNYLLRQTIFPIKRIVSEITNVIQKFSKEDLTKYFNDVEDHINKVLEVLESSKETIEIYKDTDFMLSAERTNRILAILTIWFTSVYSACGNGHFLRHEYSLAGGYCSRTLDLSWNRYNIDCNSDYLSSFCPNTVFVFSQSWLAY